MTAIGVTESVVEQAPLAWLESLGWRATHGFEIAPGEPGGERADYAQVVLEARLREALQRLNPVLPPEALEDAFRRLTRPEGAERAGLALRSADHESFV
jgi:type I restriction enzyme, R subunit